MKFGHKLRGAGLKLALVGATVALVAGCTADVDNGGEGEDVFPAGTATIVVPYGAGGTTDVAARRLGIGLELLLDRTVIVKNTPGGSGIPGTTEVATAKADGSTILFAVGNVFTQSELRETSYDFDSFTPITGLFGQAYILAVDADSPWETYEDFIDRDSVNFAASGWGDAQHLDNTVLYDQLGIDATAVPFDGNASATQALIGGTVDSAISDASVLMPYIESGDLRALAVLTPEGERLEYLSEVPTFEELGVDTSEFILPYWGFVAPAGTPDEVIAIWRDAIQSAAGTGEFLAFADQNRFLMMTEDAASTWYEDERTGASNYVDLLKRYGIELK